MSYNRIARGDLTGAFFAALGHMLLNVARAWAGAERHCDRNAPSNYQSSAHTLAVDIGWLITVTGGFMQRRRTQISGSAPSKCMEFTLFHGPRVRTSELPKECNLKSGCNPKRNLQWLSEVTTVQVVSLALHLAAAFDLWHTVATRRSADNSCKSESETGTTCDLYGPGSEDKVTAKRERTHEP
ncbi:uncharacterized protein BCR38DRAFT_490816 [Pseudomassariella vexata]|uniref:Uncharacterized protein n=1 Tax=Pseudomassariella vexata TaxID=1141098 RepID=A0A1Y2DA61_9PEZI|nr:uncharacterized protein BCR38DRAFT_490816 [Pseudomassariella vexata]ORY56161.1 hypothetical protein BCR38DRAFT_490816 [Pseudomassariella vexata]